MFKIILSAGLLSLRLPFLLLLIIFGLITIAFYPRDIRFFKKQHFSIMMMWMRCLSMILGLKSKIIGQVDTTADQDNRSLHNSQLPSRSLEMACVNARA